MTQQYKRAVINTGNLGLGEFGYNDDGKRPYLVTSL